MAGCPSPVPLLVAKRVDGDGDFERVRAACSARRIEDMRRFRVRIGRGVSGPESVEDDISSGLIAGEPRAYMFACNLCGDTSAEKARMTSMVNLLGYTWMQVDMLAYFFVIISNLYDTGQGNTCLSGKAHRWDMMA